MGLLKSMSAILAQRKLEADTLIRQSAKQTTAIQKTDAKKYSNPEERAMELMMVAKAKRAIVVKEEKKVQRSQVKLRGLNV